MKLTLFYFFLLPLFAPLGAVNYVVDKFYFLKDAFLGEKKSDEFTSFPANQMSLIYVRSMMPKEMRENFPTVIEDLIVNFSFPKGSFEKDGFHPKLEKNIYTFTKYSTGGWSKDSINQYTLTKYDKCGYDRYGYNKDGYNRSGYDKNGYDKDGFDEDGFDKDGWNKEGIHKKTGTKYNEQDYTQEEWYRKSNHSYPLTKFIRPFYSYPKYRELYKYRGDTKYDKDGFDENGWNREGIHRKTGTKYNEQDYTREEWYRKNMNRHHLANSYVRYDYCCYIDIDVNLSSRDSKIYPREGIDTIGPKYNTKRDDKA